MELLEKARQGGRGAIIATAHFGNWELLGAKIAAWGHPFKALVRRQRNEAVDRLINDHRRAMNIEPLRVGPSVKKALRALRTNAFIAIVADQDAGSRGIFVDFLGRPASSAQGPAAIALKQGCPILLALDVMKSRGRHTVHLESLLPPGEMTYSPENVRTLTERYSKRLEDYVRQYPDQWLWVHRKWKTQPRSATEQS